MWSTGCILYELLTGQSMDQACPGGLGIAFHADVKAGVHVTKTTVAALVKVQSEPGDLLELLEELLAYEPAARPGAQEAGIRVKRQVASTNTQKQEEEGGEYLTNRLLRSLMSTGKQSSKKALISKQSSRGTGLNDAYVAGQKTVQKKRTEFLLHFGKSPPPPQQQQQQQQQTKASPLASTPQRLHARGLLSSCLEMRETGTMYGSSWFNSDCEYNPNTRDFFYNFKGKWHRVADSWIVDVANETGLLMKPRHRFDILFGDHPPMSLAAAKMEEKQMWLATMDTKETHELRLQTSLADEENSRHEAENLRLKAEEAARNRLTEKAWIELTYRADSIGFKPALESPQPTVGPSVIEGYLDKKPITKATGSSKRRYFLLVGNRLVYRKNESSVKNKGDYPIDYKSTCRTTHVTGVKGVCYFEVKMGEGEQTLSLAAPDQETAGKWIAAIMAVITAENKQGWLKWRNSFNGLSSAWEAVENAAMEMVLKAQTSTTSVPWAGKGAMKWGGMRAEDWSETEIQQLQQILAEGMQQQQQQQQQQQLETAQRRALIQLAQCRAQIRLAAIKRVQQRIDMDPRCSTTSTTRTLRALKMQIWDFGGICKLNYTAK
jgi:hypothetical protein